MNPRRRWAGGVVSITSPEHVGRMIVVAPVAPAYDPPTPDELRWFMELTTEMHEQNAAGIVGINAAEDEGA